MAVQSAKIGILTVVVFAVLLVAYMWIGQASTLHYISKGFQGCPTDIIEDTPDLPRPGTKGIRLTTGEDMLFEIDLSKKTDMRPLDWKSLRQFPRAYVEITVRIDTTGRIARNYVDMDDFGSGAAGDSIWNALRTWRYKLYKSGLLSFAFNVSENKILIDVRQLTTANRYRKCSVKNKILYYISNKKEVTVNHY